MEKLVSDKNVAHLWGKVKEYCDNKTNAGSHKHDDLYYPKDGVADEFDSTKTYAVGEYCIYENKLYKCTAAITTGENFNSAKWEATTIGNVIAEIEKEVNELNSTRHDTSTLHAGSLLTYDVDVEIPIAHDGYICERMNFNAATGYSILTVKNDAGENVFTHQINCSGNYSYAHDGCYIPVKKGWKCIVTGNQIKSFQLKGAWF